MKSKLLLFSLLALAVLGLSGCGNKGSKESSAAAAPAQGEPVRDIAMEVYERIPTADLPGFVAAAVHGREIDSLNDESFNPLVFEAEIDAAAAGEDPGFNASYVLYCYPLQTGGWRAYWVAYSGMEGPTGYTAAGAYNYVDGVLTPEETWTLPYPPVWRLMNYVHSTLPTQALYEIAESPNYFFDFSDRGVGVTLDLDYLTYDEDGGEMVILPEVETWSYSWNGFRFVRQDGQGNALAGEIDYVDLYAIARALDLYLPALDWEINGFSQTEDDRTILAVRAYPCKDGSWKIVSADQKNVVNFYDYRDGVLTPVPRGPINDLLGDIFWANEGCYVDLTEEGIRIARLDENGTEDVFTLIRWDGDVFE